MLVVLKARQSEITVRAARWLVKDGVNVNSKDEQKAL